MSLDMLAEISRRYSGNISYKEKENDVRLLHSLLPYSYVLHARSALINGLTCGANGQEMCCHIFGDQAVWIGLTKPDLVLSQVCQKAFDAYNAQTGRYPQIVLRQNHGVFVAADTVGEIDAIMEQVTAKIKEYVTNEPDFSDVAFDRDLACFIAPALRMLYANDGKAVAVFCANSQVLEFVSDPDAFRTLVKPFTPDHIVYCSDEPLYLEPDADYSAAFADYTARKGYKPRIVAVRGLGFFAMGPNKEEAEQARLLFLDAIKIGVYARSFGGVNPLPDAFTQLSQEDEQNQSKMTSSPDRANGRLKGKIALVTGGAQGFGKGIAEALGAEDAYIAVADLNHHGAIACAAELNTVFGQDRAIALAVDVSDEKSVKHMIQDIVLAFGGLDVLLSNAGVLIAGGLSDLSKKSFDLVTAVNYTGYFLCTKYAAEPMKIQNRYAPGYLTDVIEINSKSGLEGSNRNFAYAGGKFGGIGLTQSFAKELVEYGVKVNAICPGNLLDGPLWSDPERGLFRQYLDSGKVAGAKTIDDVRKFYEAKVPMKRGCTITDVVRAILYVIEQEYETGQAIPVTGGQIMLH